MRQVALSIPYEDARVAAACLALEPHPWRSQEPELIARRVLAASDREGLRTLLVRVPGAVVGTWSEMVPTEPDDLRVAALVWSLEAHRWKHLSLSSLCRWLVAVADQLSPDAAI